MYPNESNRYRTEQEFGACEPHRNAIASPASTTGSDQAQVPNHETAAAPTTQPEQNPPTSSTVFLRRSLAPSISGSPRASVSSRDSTPLVQLPVITAVEGAPGTARRRSANWHAMAETAIMAATAV